MKLIFVSSMVAAAFGQSDKLLDPLKQLDKFRGHVDLIWNTWYEPVCKAERRKRFDRLRHFITRIQTQYESCGFFDASLPDGGPPVEDGKGYRKRRDEGEDGTQEESVPDLTPPKFDAENLKGLQDQTVSKIQELLAARISKTDKNKANKQLGNLMKKFAERYLTRCETKLTTQKVVEKALHWTTKLDNVKCAGGAGNA